MTENEVVIDASALLALLKREPGADRVMAALPDAVICSVNLAEVVGILRDGSMSIEQIRAILDGLALRVAPFDEDLAFRAGALRPATRSAGLSLGDRACLALAGRLRLPALTTDRAWTTVDAGVPVELAR